MLAFVLFKIASCVHFCVLHFHLLNNICMYICFNVLIYHIYYIIKFPLVNKVLNSLWNHFGARIILIYTYASLVPTMNCECIFEMILY